MTVDAIIDVMRVANVVLAVFAAAGLLWRIRHDWPTLPTWARYYNAGVILLVAVIGFGSAESALQQLPPGARVPFGTVALVWLMIAVYRRRSRFNKHAPRKKDLR